MILRIFHFSPPCTFLWLFDNKYWLYLSLQAYHISFQCYNSILQTKVYKLLIVHSIIKYLIFPYLSLSPIRNKIKLILCLVSLKDKINQDWNLLQHLPNLFLMQIDIVKVFIPDKDLIILRNYHLLRLTVEMDKGILGNKLEKS